MLKKKKMTSDDTSEDRTTKQHNQPKVASDGTLLHQHWGKHYHNSPSTSSLRSNGGRPNFRGSSMAVWAGRIVFVCVLFTLALLLGFLAFRLLKETENSLAETQFLSLSERALVQAKEGLLSRRWAGVTLANFVAELYPSVLQWPYIQWPGFELDVTNLLETSRGRDMGFVPFVKPSELSEFEKFAKETYAQLGFPNTTGVYDLEAAEKAAASAASEGSNKNENSTESSENDGFGVWARNTSVTPAVKYHDITAETFYGSPHEILAPIFRTDEGYHPVLLFNPHSQKFTGQAIDNLLTCSEQRKKEYKPILEAEAAERKQNNETDSLIKQMPPNQCGVLTDIFWNVKLGGRWSVANFLPIYPLDDPLEVVGYIPSIFIVDELLQNVFAKEITGIDAVFETDAKTVSYTIINGEAVYTGEGKLYDPKYQHLQQTIQLADPELYTTGGNSTHKNKNPKSFVFTLTPNDDFYQVYQTSGPLAAAVVVLCSVFLTMFVFLIYDYFVRREFSAKHHLLDARRQFMRFVSHEVRTPLNAVYMGLDLMQSELAQALGFESTDDMFVASSQRNLQQQQNDGVEEGLQQQEQKQPIMIMGDGEEEGIRLSREEEEMIQQEGALKDDHRYDDDDVEAQSNRTGLSTSLPPPPPPPSTPPTTFPLFAPTTPPPSERSRLSSSSSAGKVVMISPERAQEWFELSQEIQGNAQGAVDILNDLLNYDKIEQGTLQLGLEVLCVWQLLEKAILEFRLPASSKNIHLDVAFDIEGKDYHIIEQQQQQQQVQDFSDHLSSSNSFQRARDLPAEVLDLRVIGDSVRLTQVIRNLMSNALKFTPANGTIHVQTTYQHSIQAGQYQTIELQKGQIASGNQLGNILVRVTDTGAGMTKDQVSRLFQEGVQFNVNELQAGGGSGLGLYIAKGIVKQHNGNLLASSKGIGHGSTFEMTLPLWKVIEGDSDCCGMGTHVQRRVEKRLKRRLDQRSLQTATTTSSSSSQSLKAQSSSQTLKAHNHEADEKDENHSMISVLDSTERTCTERTIDVTASNTFDQVAPPALQVLVVDDVKSNRKLLKRLLENNGHQCDEAENGKDCVEMVKKASDSGIPYDSILLDYEMPIMDGPTAAKQIREELKDDTINIVGITGNVLPDDVKFFLSAGANDVLAKPVKMKVLFESWMESGVMARP